MLWYKSLVETRRWSILAVTVLAAQVVALYVAYPMDPLTSYPNGALGVLPDEMARLRTGDFRGYVWVRWFSTTMLLFWPVYVIALAGTDLESSAGREYLLSLPVSRRRIVLTRMAVAWAQIAVLTVLPSLLLTVMAPLRGQHYPIQDVLAHSAILLVGGMCLFGVTMFLRTAIDDVAAFVAVGALVVLGLILTFVVEEVTPYSLFRVMNGAEYFFHQRVPWTGLALSALVGGAFVLASLAVVERREY